MAKREKYGPDVELATDDEMEMILEGFEVEDDEEEVEGAFTALDEDQIESIVGTAIDEAVAFIADEIADRRIKSQRYFNGEVDIGEEEGRSTIVSTKCRDTVRSVKPSIQRVFMTSERPVEFIPSGPEDVASMEQASIYAAAKFRQNNGYQILRDVTHDALVSITGFTKAYWAEYDSPKVYDFTDLDEAQYQAIEASPGAEIVRVEQRPDEETIRVMQEQVDQAQAMAEQAQAAGQQVDPSQIPQMPAELPQLYDVRVIRRNPAGKLCIDTIPPEDFFVDRNARGDDDFYIIGHRTEMRAADVIAMGIDEDKVIDLDNGSTVDMRDQEEEERRRYPIQRDEDENAEDPSMKKVMVTEAYMRVDVDGTGMPVLHKFLMGGTANRLLSYEPVDDHPFAGWHVDPEPHTYFGRSLVEIIERDQDTATAITRGIIDNVMLTNNPRTEAVKGQVEMDDLLNNEIGAIVRVNQPGMLRELTVPFVAGQTLPALQYIDQMAADPEADGEAQHQGRDAADQRHLRPDGSPSVGHRTGRDRQRRPRHWQGRAEDGHAGSGSANPTAGHRHLRPGQPARRDTAVPQHAGRHADPERHPQRGPLLLADPASAAAARRAGRAATAAAGRSGSGYGGRRADQGAGQAAVRRTAHAA